MTRWHEQLNVLRGKNGKERQEMEEHKNNSQLSGEETKVVQKRVKTVY